MSWYDTDGKLPNFVIYSETNYKRNLANTPFVGKCNPATLKGIADKIDTLLTQNGFRREEIDQHNFTKLNSLAEKGFVDADFLTPTPIRALYFNEPCSLAISIGGRDLITVRSLVSGTAVCETRNIASGAEELLDKNFEFAYSDFSGYLSSIPSKCGSGATFSSLVYLPSIRIKNRMSFLQGISNSDVTISPMYSDRDNSGDLYILSHSPSHFCDERGAAETFDRLISSVVSEEVQNLANIEPKVAKKLMEEGRRAYGSLIYAKELSEDEMLSLCSKIRLASALCEIKNIQTFSIKTTTLNTIIAKALNYSVIYEKGECASEEECNSYRAVAVSNLLRQENA